MNYRRGDRIEVIAAWKTVRLERDILPGVQAIVAPSLSL